VVRAVRALARDPEQAAAVLKLGPKQRGELPRNRMVASSPTLPAIDRYTGVLYDALDAGSLPDDARARAAETVLVQSALFGPVGALDPIPAYRLSHDSRLPGLPLKAHWAATVTRELRHAGPLLDLRSGGYAALGPLPDRDDTAYLRVLARGGDGTTRALNHFNKKAKGEFTRALLTAADPPETLEDLLDWAPGAGFVVEAAGPRELALVVTEG
jgi:hypothetical protein